MNPISYAIDHVLFVIPRDVLDIVFNPTHRYGYHNYGFSPEDVTSVIRSEIIENKVRIDCNLTGGQQVDIPLLGIPEERVDHYSAIYRIPKTMTMGRSIVRAMCVVFIERTVSSINHTPYNGGSQMIDGIQGVLASHSAIPQTSSAYVTLIGENVVLIQDNTLIPRNSFLRCVLDYDEAMTHIQPTSYKKFARLVEYATKAYIYREFTIRQNRGALHAGMELGAIRDIVESYSDAAENYEDYYQNTWRKVAIFNDNQSHIRHLKMITGGRW